MRDLAQRVPDDGVHHTVDAHALPDGRVRIGDNTFSAEEFADMLRRDPNWDGRPIRLLSCDAGSSGLARDLANELGVPVTASRDLAWTDSNGTVFSTGRAPDGGPTWPPDGGWDTHHPDGTTTPASDNGFHPPHDGEAPGDRPEDAARSEGDDDNVDDSEEDDGEKAAHKALIDRLNTLHEQKPEAAKDLLNQYYDQDKNGVIHRKRHYAKREELKFAGQEIPAIRIDSNGRYALNTGAKEVTAEASYQGATRQQDGPIPEEWSETADDLAHGRPSIQANTKEAADSVRGNQYSNSAWTHPDSEAPPLDEFDRSGFNHARSVTGEALGELAQHHFLHELEQRGYQFQPLNAPTGNAGHFDGIRRGKNPDGEPVYVVTEAKGPSAGLGAREGFEQGSREYFESILSAMEKRGGDERELAEDMRAALDRGEVEYHLVQANTERFTPDFPEGHPGRENPASHEKYTGYTTRQFRVDRDETNPDNRPGDAEARGDSDSRSQESGGPRRDDGQSAENQPGIDSARYLEQPKIAEALERANDGTTVKIDGTEVPLGEAVRRMLPQHPELVRLMNEHAYLEDSLLARPKTIHSLLSEPRAIEILEDAAREVDTRGPDAVNADHETSGGPEPTPLTEEQQEITQHVRETTERYTESDQQQAGFDASRLHDTSYQEEYLQKLYDDAYGDGGAQQELAEMVREIANETGGEAGYRTTQKNWARALDKVEGYDGDASKLTDLAGAKIQFGDTHSLYRALEQVSDHPQADIVRYKDRFATPQKSGYRDVQMNVRMSNGHIAELRLHLRAVDDVSKYEHALYEVRRDIETLTKSQERERTPEETALDHAIVDRVREQFWNATRGGI